MKQTCEFQKYRNWGGHDCNHPKKPEDIRCDGDYWKCSHREMMRNDCLIAGTYLQLNLESIHLNRVKACRYINDCKRDCVGRFPECTKEGTIKWAERFKGEFKAELKE